MFQIFEQRETERQARQKADIDFVIPWVDGSDLAWRKERQHYLAEQTIESDNREMRFRDWENLRFWFRSIEAFAPWVRRIHFVTWGHVPSWLNIAHPKLRIVRHTDYIPREYLPTYNSHTIELNLHRIPELAERFVYFNDDTFIIAPMRPGDFFVKGLPCDSAILNVHCYDVEKVFVMAPIRDVGVINKYFAMKSVLLEKPSNWFSIRYGMAGLRNIYLLPCPRFPGFLQQHLPNSYRKKTFYELWEKEPRLLDHTCRHRFRHVADLNQWVFREWQLAGNSFYPRRADIGKTFLIRKRNMRSIVAYLKGKKGKMISVNDDDMGKEEFHNCKKILLRTLGEILPQKSSFER